MIADALKNRTELQESSLVLENSELSRKTARNALLPRFLSTASMPAPDTPALPIRLNSTRRPIVPAGFRRRGRERLQLLLAGISGGLPIERSAAQPHRQGRPVPHRARVPAVAGLS